MTRALFVLGGSATLGDLVVITARRSDEVERTLERLMADDRVQVTVTESATLDYRLNERRTLPRSGGSRRWTSRRGFQPVPTPTPPKRRRSRGFEQKTLRLIRARGGVLSLAELVEHTGLPLKEAEAELRRLSESYGGEGHPSLDGHVVYAFPELMVTSQGPPVGREPRPAWVRARDPMRNSATRRREKLQLVLGGVGFLGVAGAGLFVLSEPGLVSNPAVVAITGALLGVATFVFGRRVVQAWGLSPRFRFRNQRTLRRYALGYVVETALKGKGVVSLERTMKYLQARAGKSRVRRASVESALRQLAVEFDAPITELNGDFFFGFRNVKRQFLASEIERRRLNLARATGGETLFDSGDSELAAGERELAAFDLELRYGVRLTDGDRASIHLSGNEE